MKKNIRKEYLKLKEQKSLEHTENKVYINVMTFMGLFVSIFSLITLNFSQANFTSMTKEAILTMNLSLGVVIALFMGLILIFLNKARSKWFLGSYIVLFGVIVFTLCCII